LKLRTCFTEAFPWASAPAYLVRDNDRAYGDVFKSRVRAMGIRDRPISPGSPWQNGYAERLIGTVRRECLDRVLIFGESRLRRVLASYAAYYNQARTHLALQKDAPLASSSPTVRCHYRHPNLGRTASSICSDMIFGKDRTGQSTSNSMPATSIRPRPLHLVVFLAASVGGLVPQSWAARPDA
jgi:hypothetical protein